MERDKHLAAFLAELRQALDGGDDPCADAMVREVYANLATVGELSDKMGQTIAVCDHLTPALEICARRAETLADAIARLSPRLTWRPRSGAVGHREPPNEAVPGNAMIVGPGGIEERSDIWIGMSLLAPGVVYPDHRHPPPEVYIVLTGGQFRQEQGEWFTPGPGGVFFNTPNIVHAMRATAREPLLAIWLQDVALVRQ